MQVDWAVGPQPAARVARCNRGNGGLAYSWHSIRTPARALASTSLASIVASDSVATSAESLWATGSLVSTFGLLFAQDESVAGSDVRDARVSRRAALGREATGLAAAVCRAFARSTARSGAPTARASCRSASARARATAAARGIACSRRASNVRSGASARRATRAAASSARAASAAGPTAPSAPSVRSAARAGARVVGRIATCEGRRGAGKQEKERSRPHGLQLSIHRLRSISSWFRRIPR